MPRDASALERFACTVPGNPGDAAVNGWKRPVIRRGKGGKPKPSATQCTAFKRWKARAALAFRAAARGRQFSEGPLTATVRAYWPRIARQGAAKGLAFGDVDAVAKAALDALEAAGVVEDDAQIVEVHLSKSYCAVEPRIEIEVVRA